MVFSDEVGAMKPAPKIFLRALAELEVEPDEAIYVGDRLESDVKGAAGVGMWTIQALWFEADDTPPGVEPDFLAFTPMDVLNIARRVAR
jgi:putative hydrolase of the HAD superfamily